jgi:hypothetical protein
MGRFEFFLIVTQGVKIQTDPLPERKTARALRALAPQKLAVAPQEL